MRIRNFSLMAALAVIVAFAASMQAQQNTGGSIVVGVFGQTGDPSNGGFTSTNGGSSYNASDPTKATGSADGTTSGNNTLTEHNNVVKAVSGDGINTGATAKGNNTSITFGGGAQSGTGIDLGGNTTFVNGGTVTDGNYFGSGDSDAPLQGSGSAVTKNKTIGSSTGDGTNDAQSNIKVVGSSKSGASLDGQCLTTPNVWANVGGGAAANLQAVAGNPNGSFAGASGTGNTQFSASNPTGAPVEGSQTILGSTTAQVANNGSTVSSTSKMSSTAQAH